MEIAEKAKKVSANNGSGKLGEKFQVLILQRIIP